MWALRWPDEDDPRLQEDSFDVEWVKRVHAGTLFRKDCLLGNQAVLYLTLDGAERARKYIYAGHLLDIVEVKLKK